MANFVLCVSYRIGIPKGCSADCCEKLVLEINQNLGAVMEWSRKIFLFYLLSLISVTLFRNFSWDENRLCLLDKLYFLLIVYTYDLYFVSI